MGGGGEGQIWASRDGGQEKHETRQLFSGLTVISRGSEEEVSLCTSIHLNKFHMCHHWFPGKGYVHFSPTFYITPPTTILGYLNHPFLFIYLILGVLKKSLMFLVSNFPVHCAFWPGLRSIL